MQGLAVSNRYDLIENMLDNFKYLIDTYGVIFTYVFLINLRAPPVLLIFIH